MTGRTLNDRLGYWFVGLFTVGSVGAALVMLAGGADGMPRRHGDWAQGGWMVYGDWIQLTGLFMAAGMVVFVINLMKSRQIPEAVESPAPAE